MSQVNVVMCAGFSPSARILRTALRRISENEDVKVVTTCPAAAGLSKYEDELRALDPNRTLVVDGCEGCCGMQALMLYGIMPRKNVVLDKYIIVDERSIKASEERILEALREMRA